MTSDATAPKLPTCVLVRDIRCAVGGFETWVRSLDAHLPRVGIRVITLHIGRCTNKHDSKPDREHLRLDINVQLMSDDAGQARAVLDALHHLTLKGYSGVFFTGGYHYIDIAGINLQGSSWMRIPVVHGKHPSAYDWVCLGPPWKAIVPARDLLATYRQEFAKRIGWLRTFTKVQHIAHGVQLVSKQRIASRYVGREDDPIRIAVVTRLNEDIKRPFDYVRIADGLQRSGVKYEMKIAGDGPASAAMRGMVVELGLSESLTFVGALSQGDVYELLLASEIFLQTSESEAFGLSVAESMACGCAVVAARIDGELAKMVSEKTGITVPVGDISAYVDAIRALALDRQGAASMGRAGRLLIERDYSLDRMVNRYADIVLRACHKMTPKQNWVLIPNILLTPSDAVGLGLRARLTLKALQLLDQVSPRLGKRLRRRLNVPKADV